MKNSIYVFLYSQSFRRRNGRKIIDQHVIVDVPGQHGGVVKLCAAISNSRFLHYHAALGPNHTEHHLVFLAREQQVHLQAVHPV